MKNLLNLTTNGEINNFSIAVSEIFNSHLSQFPNVQKKFKVAINGNLIPSSYPFKNQSELVVVEKEIDINNSRNLHMWLGHDVYSHVVSGKYIRGNDNVLANADCDLVANILLAFLEQCYLVNDLKFRSQNNITSDAIADLKMLGVELLARGGKAYGTKTIEKALPKYTKQLKVIRSLEYVKPSKRLMTVIPIQSKKLGYIVRVDVLLMNSSGLKYHRMKSVTHKHNSSVQNIKTLLYLLKLLNQKQIKI